MKNMGGVHDAIQETLPEGEVLVSWILVAEVAPSTEPGTHLIHRAGGGADGEEAPTSWSALGMLESAAGIAKQQVLEWTRDPRKE